MGNPSHSYGTSPAICHPTQMNAPALTPASKRPWAEQYQSNDAQVTYAVWETDRRSDGHTVGHSIISCARACVWPPMTTASSETRHPVQMLCAWTSNSRPAVSDGVQLETPNDDERLIESILLQRRRRHNEAMRRGAGRAGASPGRGRSRPGYRAVESQVLSLRRHTRRIRLGYYLRS